MNDFLAKFISTAMVLGVFGFLIYIVLTSKDKQDG